MVTTLAHLSAARGARGPMATREEYLARSKEAAIALLEGGDLLAAIALMISDLRHLDGLDAETQRILIADEFSPATQRTKSASGSTDSIERDPPSPIPILFLLPPHRRRLPGS